MAHTDSKSEREKEKYIFFFLIQNELVWKLNCVAFHVANCAIKMCDKSVIKNVLYKSKSVMWIENWFGFYYSE